MDKCSEHSAHDQHLSRLDARVLELEDANKELCLLYTSDAADD